MKPPTSSDVSINYTLEQKYTDTAYWFIVFLNGIVIGYEPAGPTMHPPPKTIEGGFIFFA